MVYDDGAVVAPNISSCGASQIVSDDARSAVLESFVYSKQLSAVRRRSYKFRRIFAHQSGYGSTLHCCTTQKVSLLLSYQSVGKETAVAAAAVSCRGLLTPSLKLKTDRLQHQ